MFSHAILEGQGDGSAFPCGPVCKNGGSHIQHNAVRYGNLHSIGLNQFDNKGSSLGHTGELKGVLIRIKGTSNRTGNSNGLAVLILQFTSCISISMGIIVLESINDIQLELIVVSSLTLGDILLVGDLGQGSVGSVHRIALSINELEGNHRGIVLGRFQSSNGILELLNHLSACSDLLLAELGLVQIGQSVQSSLEVFFHIGFSIQSGLGLVHSLLEAAVSGGSLGDNLGCGEAASHRELDDPNDVAVVPSGSRNLVLIAALYCIGIRVHYHAPVNEFQSGGSV